MKSTFTLICLTLFLGLSAQNEEVKTYYQAHNQILENFAKSQDTTRYLQEMSLMIEENGKHYIRLTHHNRFLDLCLAQRDLPLAKLVLRQGLKHDVFTYYRLQDTLFRNNSKRNYFYNSPEVIQLIADSKSDYADLMKNVNLHKFSLLSSILDIDQFGRTVIDVPSLNTNKRARSEIMQFTDSSNLVRLYEYIEEFGFPNSVDIGYFNYYMLMWHTYCRPCGTTYTLPNGQWYYNYIDSVFYQAALGGKIPNTEYAYLKDKSMNQQWADMEEDCDWQGQKYVTWYAGKIDHTLFDAKNIDKHRAEIYLPPYWVDAVLNGWEIPDDYPVPDGVPLKY